MSTACAQSLFIGAITFGMFIALRQLQEEESDAAFEKMRHGKQGELPPLMILMDTILQDVEPTTGEDVSSSLWVQVVIAAARIRDSKVFQNVIMVSIIFVGVWIGYDTDVGLSCDSRFAAVVPVPENCGRFVSHVSSLIDVAAQVSIGHHEQLFLGLLGNEMMCLLLLCCNLLF